MLYTSCITFNVFEVPVPIYVPVNGEFQNDDDKQ